MAALDRTVQPTLNEKAALVGTVGSPAAANAYVTNEDERLNTTPDQGTRLLSGGGITWISGYTVRVSACVVVFSGVTVNCPETNIVLDAADPTDDRIDLIVANTNGTITKITGTASTPPASPDYDPVTQFQLGFINVDAASAQPSDVSLTTIYDENVEWTTAPGAGVDPNSVAAPYHGVKNIDVLAGAITDIVFTAPADFALDGFTSLVLRVQPKVAWGSGYIHLAWSNSGGKRRGTYVIVSNGAFGFNSASLVYQTIYIPLSMFSVTAGDATIRKLRIYFPAGISTYIDFVQLQSGSDVAAPPSASVPYATETSEGVVILATDGEVTAGQVPQSNDSRLKMGCVMTLCNGFTPGGTGVDTAELVVPYHPKDGTTSVTWNVRRITLRVATAGGAPSARVEKSTVAGAFAAATVGDVTLGVGAYEASVTAALGTVASGNKLRMNALVLGTAQYWTLEVELGES
jgi:hypothetical protein